MMKKVLLFLCALLLTMNLAAADADKPGTAEEFAALLNQYRAEGLTEFTIKCESALLTELKADNNALLSKLTLLAGIEDYSFRTNRNGQVIFTGVAYSDGAVVECVDREAVRAAVLDYMNGGSGELTMVCTAEDFEYFFNTSGMRRMMAELGVENYTLKGDKKNCLYLSEIQMMTDPYAQVSSVSEAGEKIAAWREQNVPAFTLIFDMDTYSALSREDHSLIAFLGGLDKYTYSSRDSIGTIRYYDVVYNNVPGVYCVSEAEVVAAIQAMGAKGITSFQLKLDQPTFDAVYSDRFARLYALEAQAGMSDGDLRYSTVSRLLLIDNAVINANVTALNTLQEVTAYVEAAAQRGDKDINMLIDAAVYADLMEGVSSFFASDAKFYDLIANAGICGADDISFNRHAGAINLKGVQYYAGTNILRALETGDLSVLTAREQQALAAAQQLAADCTRETPAETALAIHDALCAMVTYVNDESTDEDDCCIGALLDGRANCDGYADALLLTGRLAGLNVRYQHGDSLNGGMGSYFSTHMWNLIELDGTWRMIDATWDDSGDNAYHLWFNIGEDRAAKSHVWSREMTVPMQPVTDAATRPVAEYFAANEAEITAAAIAAQAAGHQVFDVFVDENSGLRMIAAREALLQGLYGSISYSWIDAFNCLHVKLNP